ncbi:MAG: TonB-dependent receptor [Gemmatimonadota bacterium]|nr:MAG: TonB-dependent receptor [Gemmatimonadota bacterium]
MRDRLLNHHIEKASARRAAALSVALLGLAVAPAAPSYAQTSGQILGRVIDAQTREVVPTAEISIEELAITVLTSERGDFIMAAVPAGLHRVRAARLGFRTTVVPVRVRPGRTTQVTIELPPTPVEVEGVTAEVERVRLIEPDVAMSHEVVLGRDLRELPVDKVEDAIELTTGVSDGHFRGSRVGQETYRIDGLEVRNQFEASTEGAGLEMSPTALEEIEVATGGFGAGYGTALAGVVSYITRRGGTERWEGRAGLLSDHWAPDGLLRGFNSFSASLGGPIHFIGRNSTIFADLLAQGMIDGEPRARGLTCLRQADGDSALAIAIEQLADNPATAHLYCPYSAARLPYQRGDKLIGFLRVDRPLGQSANLTLSLLHSRRQEELYTPEFKYNSEFQLGQRSTGTLASLMIDWAGYGANHAYHVVARAAALRLDRHLGVVDPWTFDERSRLAGFGFADFRFLGEDFVRTPIEEQLVSGRPVPGYREPGGSIGSPFGPAAEGILFTEGTPGIANWNRSEFVGADLTGELLWTRGHALRAGASTRFHRIESYERTQAYLPGSLPSYARFFPRTVSGHAEVSLLAAHDITIRLGLRVEAFNSELAFQEDRVDFLAPAIEPEWRVEVMPRLGLAIPVPGTAERTMFRLNYGQVAQPPDFRFFLDTTIGDSLRTDIRRQGNPDLTFERGTTWEAGATHLLSPHVSLDATIYYKELHNLVTSSLSFTGIADRQFTTGDFGTIRGLELSGQAVWPWLRLRAGYAYQHAKGVTSSAFEDLGEGASADRREFPLAFDRRHAADLAAALGRAAGTADQKWGLTLTGSLRSGFPLDRTATESDEREDPGATARLPWTAVLNLRLSRDFTSLPGCRRCAWRIIADGRNILGRDNIVALRRDTRSVAPSADELLETAREIPLEMEPIPLESPRYSALVDLNGDGRLSGQEMRTARFAAALDRNDPSLYFGSALELRLGVEVSF